uniref:Uncharacterized protein n=1 Tax=Branchiostoma floridae TaxID=7739 RepID=C3ZU03_BRAFL|eukprot:XP_002587878.1 hypothetical protein BRAFLDRAFT_87265 [Branchiostoma floridae]
MHGSKMAAMLKELNYISLDLPSDEGEGAAGDDNPVAKATRSPRSSRFLQKTGSCKDTTVPGRLHLKLSMAAMLVGCMGPRWPPCWWVAWVQDGRHVGGMHGSKMAAMLVGCTGPRWPPCWWDAWVQDGRHVGGMHGSKMAAMLVGCMGPRWPPCWWDAWVQDGRHVGGMLGSKMAASH